MPRKRDMGMTPGQPAAIDSAAAGFSRLNQPHNQPEALGWMAERAQPKGTVVVEGASHVVMVSHPDKVASLIEEAAAAK